MNASTIGLSIPQVNAKVKVTGKALYAGDIKIPGMLHGKVLRSLYPKARILSIDVSKALELPGVKVVITGEDCPKTKWGVNHKDRTILARGEVRFAGEEIAAVAAITEDIARDALDLIRVEYQALDPILSVEQALHDQARVHEGHTNLAHEIKFHKGDVGQAFAQSDLVLEQTYSTHAQYPGYLEPMATVASIDPEGRLLVWTSTQSIFLVRARLAAALERSVSSIQVHQAMTGGGFGGKIIEDANSLIAGLLAIKANAPIRLVNNRLEDFQAACSSLPEKIRIKLGMTKKGLILAKEVDIMADCGAYAGLTPEVMHVSAMRSDNMHQLKNVRCHARLFYTNNPPHGAFRGFGGTQMLFALNSHIDTMAHQLKLDVFDVHRLNAIGQGDTSVHGWIFGSTGLQACLDMVRQEIQWDHRLAHRNRAHASKKRGLGVATAMHVSGNRTIGNWDGSTVSLRINEDGHVFIYNAESDAGQGATTVLSQICAAELDVPLSQVSVLQPNTDVSPYAIGSLASRVTTVAGNAALLAARKAKDELIGFAAEKFKLSPSELICENGFIWNQSNPDQKWSLGDLVKMHIWRQGGSGFQVSATWDAKTTMPDDNFDGNIAPGYSFAAQAVEVEVDIETGKIEIIDSFVADDCGKALNPQAVHGQSNGAAAQAIGWTLFENLLLEGGRMLNGNFADYTMPTPHSLPMLRSGIVESNEPNGPYGAKGASETAILPGAPAIANAIFNAIGVRICDLPITPEKILAALEAKRSVNEGV